VGDDEGFAEFVHGRQSSLLRTAWLLTGSTAQAEDLVQHALMKTLPRWAQLSRDGFPEAYVRRVMMNAFLTWRRRLASHERPRSDVGEMATEERGYAHVDARLSLKSALSDLPRGQRAAVVLRYYEGLSEAETAEVLGCSVGTVKSQAWKGLLELRSKMTADGEERVNRHGC